MSKLTLRGSNKQALMEQIIDAERPGPILHDFGIVLEYIGLEGVKANGKYNLLPIDAIAILDDRLSRPLRLNLKRPQLKSHPYLQALHMLLRATGLTHVDASDGPARLVVDPDMLEQWSKLNPTEQYFNLLEAAFVHGAPEMIGERGRRFNDWLSTCAHEWERLPAKGKRFDLRRPTYVYVMGRQLFVVAFADLFGLMEVEHPAFPVQPWVPAALGHTPFGDAMFELILQCDLHYGILETETDAAPSFGIWQEHFQPYFPHWRANLCPPEPKLREGVFHFKVSLGSMWREIAMADSMDLDDLAHAILDAVDFESDHLYEFTYRDNLGRTVTAAHEYCDEGPFAADIEIDSLPLVPGQSMTFHFDFGDDWRFNVKLEKIAPANPRMKKPKLVAQRGAAPQQYPDADCHGE
jgi:hypothetical protein